MSFVLLASLLLICIGSEARALPFSQLVVLGDSYSDTGNAGRSADGLMWSEFLAERLGIAGGVRPSSQGGSSYAVGGATALGPDTNHFPHQLDRYLDDSAVVDHDALHAIWIGFNDIQFFDPANDLGLYAQSIVDVIEDSMLSLWNAGARHFLVPTAWDYATTTLAQFLPRARRESQAELSLVFSQKLELMLGDFREPVFRMDAYALSQYINGGAWRLGFTEGRYGYCGQREDCTGYVWKDQIHPSSAVHEILAERAYQGILEDLGLVAPEPGTGLLVGLGLVLLGARGRRRSGRGWHGGSCGPAGADRAHHGRVCGDRAGVRSDLRRKGVERGARGAAPRAPRGAGGGDPWEQRRRGARPAR